MDERNVSKNIEIIYSQFFNFKGMQIDRVVVKQWRRRKKLFKK